VLIDGRESSKNQEGGGLNTDASGGYPRDSGWVGDENSTLRKKFERLVRVLQKSTEEDGS